MNPEEQAFLDALAAGDGTARLVFADWLDERRNPRGPWVRDPELWAFMAPNATDPVPRLLERVGGAVPDGHAAGSGRTRYRLWSSRSATRASGCASSRCEC